MHGVNVSDMKFLLHLGGTFLFSTGGTIVLSGLGGAINSFGGDGISILGTSLVSGLAQPTRNRKESATKNFMALPPSSSMAYLVI